MRFSLCNEAIGDRPFADQCAFAAALGYDGFELAPYTLAEDPRDITAAMVADTKAAMDAHGLATTGLHWLLVNPIELSITTADDALRETTLEVMEACVDLCADLGGRALVHGSPKQRAIGPDDDRAACEARALEVFRAVAAQAEFRGVVYCLEPLRAQVTSYVNTLAEAAAVVDAVGSPGFRTMIDTSAAAVMEPDGVAAAIRQWIPSGHVAHIQFNDRNRRGPGQGDDKFGDILQALIDVGYTGDVALEPFIFEPTRDACAALSIGYVKGLWETLG